MTLECVAEGKPTPNIAWVRLSDNRDVVMPLTNISRWDAGMYRCTAHNGVGSPATGNVLLVVQCECPNVCTFSHFCFCCCFFHGVFCKNIKHSKGNIEVIEGKESKIIDYV